MRKAISYILLILVSIYLLVNFWYLFVILVVVGLIHLNNKRKNNNQKTHAGEIKLNYQVKEKKPNYNFNYPAINGINEIVYCSEDEMPDEFVVLDIETTGLDPINDEIIEIAILKYLNGKKVDTFHSLVKPDEKIPEQITKINGITNNMVKHAPRIDEIIDKIYDLINEAKFIVGYNVNFDLSFIGYALGRYGKFIDKVLAIDVHDFVRKHYYHLNDRKLETMKNYFGIAKVSHRADDDCEVTVEVWRRGLEEVRNRERAIINQMEELYNSLNENEKKFIDSLKIQLGDLKDKLRYNVMSDKTINFKIGDYQIGRVKLSGRKYKMQILDRDNVVWLDISGVDEAINNIKHWVKYAKKLRK